MSERIPTTGSLRNRLAVSLIGGALLLSFLVFALIREYATQIAQESQDSILNASIMSILDAASLRNGNVEIDLPYGAFSMLNSDSDDRVFYAISQNDQFLSGYEGLTHLVPLQDRDSVFHSRNFHNDRVRLATASRTLIGSNESIKITVSMAQTQDALAGTLARISLNAAAFGAAFFGLATLLSFWATSATIAPLNNLTTSVTRRGPNDLRPFSKPVPAEMKPLVVSLNTLMRRLDQSLSQSEDFIAEAAHRVRTPLATVRAQAEATLQRVDKDENRQALRTMIRAIDESSRAAGQLLEHAMITFRADHLETNSINLNDLVRELVLRLEPIAEMVDIDLQVSSTDEVMILGDAILLQSAVRNILDNAFKYTPRDNVVQIAIEAAPSVCIKIYDRGPGFPAHEIDQMTTRFKRGKNADGTIGSGLGLTIARDVIVAHGGRLSLENRQGGGACVSLSF